MSLKVAIAHQPAEIDACLALRRLVFIGEQGVPESEEVDGQDCQCTHILATLNGAPVGAARFQYKGNYAKIQRVCVPDDQRGSGIGAEIIRFMVAQISEERKVNTVQLGSQIQALGFYRKLGFTEFGEEYLDAGIPHRDMKLELD